jgi:two-component system response regulator AtoC
LHAPGRDGLEVLREALKLRPGLPIVAVAPAYGSVNSSVDAFRLGVVDYLTMPLRAEHVAAALARATVVMGMRRNPPPPSRALPALRREAVPMRVVAASAAMKRTIALAKRVADASVPTLVLGEVGVGKETIARLVHTLGRQAQGPFVKVSCEAVGEPRLAEVLFGKERSLADGSVCVECGVIEAAAGGTLFLHHVEQLPRWMQAELLHAVQEGKFLRRDGSTPVDFRVQLAASASQDLSALTHTGVLLENFRAFLDVAPLTVPPLRERQEDIRPLMAHLLQQSDCKSTKNLRFSADALTLLEAHSWPGNVYELSNFIRRATVFASEARISAARAAELLTPARLPRSANTITVPFAGDLKRIEQSIVMEVINRFQGNKAAAARALGLHRRTLYRILEGHAAMQ